MSTVQKGESTPQLWLKDYADYGITYNEQSGGWYYNNQRIKILLDSEQAVVYTDEENGVCVTISRDGNHQISEIKEISETDAQSLIEYYGAAEPPVRCGESHLSGLTEPLRSL